MSHIFLLFHDDDDDENEIRHLRSVANISVRCFLTRSLSCSSLQSPYCV